MFVRHGLPTNEFQARLTSALERDAFSEARLLLYGVVAAADGTARVADIDRYIAEL
jgi:hypothetical protein